MKDFAHLDAATIADKVRSGEIRALAVTAACLDRITALNGVLNCFTRVIASRAFAAANAIDTAVAAGADPGPLAGVPFAVKDLFDVDGLVTTAGAAIECEQPAAKSDAEVVRRLQAAGAVLVGTTNMDEYAYGFVTENAHFGRTYNPRNLDHVAGGSSGGSAAAVAAGMVPFALGSDTNGSIRIPAAFCGVFGIKPTYGRLSRRGCFPFAPSFDHVGAFARNTRDLALVYDLMQGADPQDPAQSPREMQLVSPFLQDASLVGLRIGVLDGWFRNAATAETLTMIERIAAMLGAAGTRVILRGAEAARASAFCISAAEGANVHMQNLRCRASEFDPATRSRLLAGALLPAAATQQARRFRSWFREHVAACFRDVDILLAPCAPSAAPRIGQTKMRVGDMDVPVRANIGMYTQPLSFIGLPIIAAPVTAQDGLPMGVQIIAAPWHEAAALRVAACLEARGAVSSPIAEIFHDVHQRSSDAA